MKPRLIFYLFSALLLVACERSGPVIQELPAKTPQQIKEDAERELQAKQRAIEGARHQLAFFNEKLKGLTRQQLKQILHACQAAVLQKAKEENNGPFEVFLVDEHSADIYQAGAYVGKGTVKKDEDRIKAFLAAKKAGSQDLSSALDMRYTVMFTEDTFRGLVKRPRSYSCTLNSQLVPVIL